MEQSMIRSASIKSGESGEKGDNERQRPRRKAKRAPSILSDSEKTVSIIIVSTMAFLGPASAMIYFPTLEPLARDLRVFPGRMNLTITSYMITQALFPLLTASFSDQRGRRPVFIVCLAVYVGANIGLALQTSFFTLLFLRCLQSFGSSSLLIVALATVTDIISRAERNKYRVYTSCGYTLAPAVGPVLGGLLTQFLGWRSSFWFLAIFGGVMLLLVVTFLPETCRALVGNGSVPPQRWNKPLVGLLHSRSEVPPDYQSLIPSTRRPSVLDAIRLALKSPAWMLILFQTALFCGTMTIFASIPVVFQRRYAFKAWQIGLTYLPYAVGGFTARWMVGPWTTRNLDRYQRLIGTELVDNDPRLLPYERARLQVTLPLVYLSCIWVAVYGWIMHMTVHVSGPLILLFLLGNSMTGSSISLTGLILGLHARQPATALAASNMARHLFGAGAVAAIIPLISAIGTGWTGTVVAFVYLISSVLLWVVYFYGARWRAGIDSTNIISHGIGA